MDHCVIKDPSKKRTDHPRGTYLPYGVKGNIAPHIHGEVQGSRPCVEIIKNLIFKKIFDIIFI